MGVNSVKINSEIVHTSVFIYANALGSAAGQIAIYTVERV